MALARNDAARPRHGSRCHGGRRTCAPRGVTCPGRPSPSGAVILPPAVPLVNRRPTPGPPCCREPTTAVTRRFHLYRFVQIAPPETAANAPSQGRYAACSNKHRSIASCMGPPAGRSGGVGAAGPGPVRGRIGISVLCFRRIEPLCLAARRDRHGDLLRLPLWDAPVRRCRLRRQAHPLPDLHPAAPGTGSGRDRGPEPPPLPQGDGRVKVVRAGPRTLPPFGPPGIDPARLMDDRGRPPAEGAGKPGADAPRSPRRDSPSPARAKRRPARLRLNAACSRAARPRSSPPRSAAAGRAG